MLCNVLIKKKEVTTGVVWYFSESNGDVITTSCHPWAKMAEDSWNALKISFHSMLQKSFFNLLQRAYQFYIQLIWGSLNFISCMKVFSILSFCPVKWFYNFIDMTRSVCLYLKCLLFCLFIHLSMYIYLFIYYLFFVSLLLCYTFLTWLLCNHPSDFLEKFHSCYVKMLKKT